MQFLSILFYIFFIHPARFFFVFNFFLQNKFLKWYNYQIADDSPIHQFTPSRSSSIFEKDEQFDNASVPDELMKEPESEGRLSNAFDDNCASNFSTAFKKPSKPSMSKFKSQQFENQDEEFNSSNSKFFFFLVFMFKFYHKEIDIKGTKSDIEFFKDCIPFFYTYSGEPKGNK